MLVDSGSSSDAKSDKSDDYEPPVRHSMKYFQIVSLQTCFDDFEPHIRPYISFIISHLALWMDESKFLIVANSLIGCFTDEEWEASKSQNRQEQEREATGFEISQEQRRWHWIIRTRDRHQRCKKLQ